MELIFQYFYLINDIIKKGNKCAFVRDATNSNSTDGHATAWKKDKQQKWQKSGGIAIRDFNKIFATRI